jgi:hypothetical protein
MKTHKNCKNCKEELPVEKYSKANFKFGLGLSCGCYGDWLLTDPKGNEYLNKQSLKAKGSTAKKVQSDWTKEKRKRTIEAKGKQDYEKDLEKVFNTFIRIRDKDKPCVSCDAKEGTYTMSAGHYFPAGSNKNIRFDEDNVHGQCWYNCNKNRHGNLSEYLPRLIARIGQDAFNELERRKQTPAHFTIPELKEMIVLYKSKIKELNKK